MSFLSQLPPVLPFGFMLTTFLTVILVNRALKAAPQFKSQSKKIALALVAWLALQLGLSYFGVYANYLDSFPLSFVPMLPPAFILMLYLFFTKTGKAFMDDLPMEELTWISIVRIPVELILYGLFVAHAIPEIMTFSGRNFDVIAGITAPLIAYFGIRKKKFSPGVLLAWNILSILLLINIIIIALLSAPTPIQQFGFAQPNVAILHFPFSWLPSFVVPMVLISHAIMIRRLLLKKEA